MLLLSVALSGGVGLYLRIFLCLRPLVPASGEIVGKYNSICCYPYWTYKILDFILFFLLPFVGFLTGILCREQEIIMNRIEYLYCLLVCV